MRNAQCTMHNSLHELANLNNIFKDHGMFKGIFLVHLGCSKFADVADDDDQSLELLGLVQKFSQLVRSIIKSYVFLGVVSSPAQGTWTIARET